MQVMTTTGSSNTLFTFFGKGHWSEKAQKFVPSTKPLMNVDVAWVAHYVQSERAKAQTQELRRLVTEDYDHTPEGTKQHEQMLRDFKLLEFDAVATAGTFNYGSANGLIMRSPYIVIDIDDLDSTHEARQVQQALIADTEVVTALCFLSPKGLGLKWWAELPAWCMGMTFAEQYATLSRYIGYEYGLLADPTGSNVNRLCFLPFDPECYTNPKYLRK